VATDETDDQRPYETASDSEEASGGAGGDLPKAATDETSFAEVEQSEPTVLSSADLLARATGDPEGDDTEEGHGDSQDEALYDQEAVPVVQNDRSRIPRFRRPAGSRIEPTHPSGPSTPSGGYRVRRVRRLVRHIEPWSVLKVSLVFYLCVWGLLVIATRMLWSAADEAGTIGKVESFIEDLFALETFEFDTTHIFRIFVLGGLVLVVGGIGVTVVLVVLFNLISDLTGGVRFTMVEEETAVRQRRLRRGDFVVPEGVEGQPDTSPGSSEASPGADTVSEAPGL